jgi:hypothetical protein
MKNQGNNCNEGGPTSETGPTWIEDEKKERAFGKGPTNSLLREQID